MGISRREFIAKASCGAMASTTLFSTLFNLKVLNAAAISNSAVFGGNDYKAMVCILLSGGNDSYNMLIPNDTSRYNDYAASRTNMAIEKEELLSLNHANLAVHPNMAEVRQLFQENKLSFISNIGTLIEPIKDKFEIRDGIVNAPIDLFSHEDQTQQWMTSIPNDQSALGWGGKIADMIMDQNENQEISMNISLAGNNIFQRGVSTTEYSVDPVYGNLKIDGYETPNLFGELRTQLIDNMVEADYQDKFRKAYIDVVKVAKESSLEFNEAMDQSIKVTNEFSDNSLSIQLRTVANIISAQENLGMKRQIFFVELFGFDNHDYALDVHGEMLESLSKGLSEFYTALEEINKQDCVTTFTISEFGRTLTSNGDGTDHAWSGHTIVMGGPVKGGQVFGDFPDLALDSDVDLGGGVLVPKVSVDEYFAELAIWFGVPKSELTSVFPNLGSFYDWNNQELPLGFLNL